MRITSPVLVATLTIGAAALALATRRPTETVTPQDASHPNEAPAQQEPWFI